MKKIILGLPQTFSLYASLKKNLEFLGYEVIDISYPNHEFKYKNYRQKIVNFLRKTFLKDKHYKNLLMFQPYKINIELLLNDIQVPVDYALLIRADIYPKNILKLIKKKCKTFIAYQWDGLDRFPQIYDSINIFDRFFVFDNSDLNKTPHNTLTTTNFAFDYSQRTNHKSEYDIFYIGSVGGKRIKTIKHFINQTREFNHHNKFLIHYTNKEDCIETNLNEIEYTDSHITYEENLSYVNRSNIIFDLLNESHNGLSFRVFEANYYGKKLITNNSEIKKYEFYHPNNIFVWDGENLDGYETFINAPRHIIPQEIIDKYSFTNWIKYILNEPPFIPTNIPL
jgi:hypothetical protein